MPMPMPMPIRMPMPMPMRIAIAIAIAKAHLKTRLEMENISISRRDSRISPPTQRARCCCSPASSIRLELCPFWPFEHGLALALALGLALWPHSAIYGLIRGSLYRALAKQMQ